MPDGETRGSAVPEGSGGRSAGAVLPRSRTGRHPTPADATEAGWRALGEGRWQDARACFEQALGEGTPGEGSPGAASAEALEGLGWVGYCLDDERLTFEARERAFRLFRDRGDPRSAARVAAWLATDSVEFRGERAVANGWLQIAHSLLDPLEPGPDHGWLALHEGGIALEIDEDTATASRLGAHAAELGRRFGVPELEMVGLGLDGRAMVCRGDLDAGMCRLDQATAVALAGGATLLACVGLACCHLITACERVRDYDRAGEWSVRAGEFSARHGIQMFVSDCRAQYGSLLMWQGSWDRAEEQLLLAAEGLAPRPALVDDALVRLGELRRRQGRLDEAEELFVRSEGHVLSPVGRAAVALDRGQPAEAVELVDRFLRRVPVDRVERSLGLELAVRAHIGLGDQEGAAEALAQLKAVAARVRTRLLRAAALVAEGALAAAGGDPDAARRSFEDALDLLSPGDGPFEVALVRLELGVVLGTVGRHRAACREVEVALTALRGLGAHGEVARAERLVGRLRGTAPARPATTPAGPLDALSSRQRQVLALVAEGLTNREIADRLVLSEHTVHRHVTNILRGLGLPSRAAAAALAARHGVG